MDRNMAVACGYVDWNLAVVYWILDWKLMDWRVADWNVDRYLAVT